MCDGIYSGGSGVLSLIWRAQLVKSQCYLDERLCKIENSDLTLL